MELIRSGPNPSASLGTMQQGPLMPWRDEEEEEEYARDPKTFLTDRCALWLPCCRLKKNLVLCVTYYLPAFEILNSGAKIYRSEKSHDEALWQGKVGLVVAKGPLAFRDEPQLGVFWHGENIEIGEWAQWDIHEARQTTIGRMHCRYLRDTQIIATWDDPRLVY